MLALVRAFSDLKSELYCCRVCGVSKAATVGWLCGCEVCEVCILAKTVRISTMRSAGEGSTKLSRSLASDSALHQ